MPKFDTQEFKHLQKLCRLNCTPEEEEAVLHSLQDVLEYLKQLEMVDTKGVTPCNYVLRSQLQNQMRDDEVKDLLPREQFLAEVPDHIGGMVRVPPVLKIQ
jgi:aspartyl-tRNA(Asn)/glutamyl-tRNA(Gln) amidotransferase subunit C